jgi:cardiolipin synthase (CMP-forming)
VARSSVQPGDLPGTPRRGQPVTGAVTDRIVTVPNAITVARLACLPIFLVLLLDRHNRAAAAWLLAVLGITDFADGYIARHFRQVSSVGQVLDPVADRLLFFLGAGGIVADGSVPGWFAAITLGREALVAVTTVVLALAGAKRIDVTWFGKAGTFGLMMAYPLFLASHSTLGWHRGAGIFAYVTGIPGMLFGLWSLVLYVPLARHALREGRAKPVAG